MSDYRRRLVGKINNGPAPSKTRERKLSYFKRSRSVLLSMGSSVSFQSDTVDFSSLFQYSIYNANTNVSKYKVLSGALVKDPDNDSPSWDLKNQK